MTWSWIALAILIFIAGALAGYRLSWMDAYQKGRGDAKARAQRAFDIGIAHGKFLAETEGIRVDIQNDKRLVRTYVPTGFD